MTIKRKSIEIKALSGDGTGLAKIATLNVIDSDGDVTLAGAFGEQEVKVLPTHDWGSVPLGKGLIKEDGDDVLVEFRLNLETVAGKEWYAALKFDLEHGRPLQEWSYGFTIPKEGWEDGVFQGREVRILKAVKVHEVSPVVLGAGVGTGTLVVKNKRPEPEGLTLTEEITGVLDGLKSATDRLEKVRAMRAEGKGRSLTDERKAQIEDLADALEGMRRAAHEINALITKTTPENQCEAQRQFLRFTSVGRST